MDGVRRSMLVGLTLALIASASTFASQSDREALPLGGAAAIETSESPASAPKGVTVDWLRSGGSLVVILGLILGLAWVARKTSSRAGLHGQLGAGGRAPSGVLEILGRYPVARGQTLVLLKLDTRVLLLSQQSGQGFRSLCEISEAEDVASLLLKTRTEDEAGMADRFKGLLKGFQREHVEADSHSAPTRRDVTVGREGDRVELLSTKSPAIGSLLDRLQAGGAR